MAISTRGALTTAVQDFLQRSDITTAMVDYWVEAFEARCNRELRCPEMEAVVSSDLDAEWSALPDDYLQIRALETDGKVMDYKTPEQFQELVAASAVPSPAVFTIADMQLRVLPAPSASSTLPVEMLYYSRLPALDASGLSNWLLASHPDLYLFGTLAEANMFLQNEPRGSTWNARANQALQALAAQGRRMSQGAATMTIKAA